MVGVPRDGYEESKGRAAGRQRALRLACFSVRQWGCCWETFRNASPNPGETG